MKLHWRVKYETLNLSLWYIELLILHTLEYNGKYSNRCTDEPWAGQNEVNVPWVERKKLL